MRDYYHNFFYIYTRTLLLAFALLDLRWSVRNVLGSTSSRALDPAPALHSTGQARLAGRPPVSIRKWSLVSLAMTKKKS